MALTVRLNPEGLPNAMDRGRRNLSLIGHGADRLMCPSAGLVWSVLRTGSSVA